MRKIALLLVLLLLLTGCAVAPGEGSTGPQTVELGEDFYVHFLDAGQGDSALLEYDGDFVLIDGGYPESGPMIVDYLQERGAEELDLVVATHGHGDHIGGLATVLAKYSAERVWSGSRPFYSTYFEDFLYYVDQQGLTLELPRIGERFLMGDGEVTLQVLGPVYRGYTDINNHSLVIMVEHGENRFLFTGDMRWEAEKDLVETYDDLSADVLKVGHHGSYTSTSYLFLREVLPTYAVISCGRNNDYGHPHAEPMSRLRDAEITIFRTDRMGTIVATSDGEEIAFAWEFSNAQPEVNS